MYSQITSSKDDYVTASAYKINGIYDSIFFFNADGNRKYPIELTALTDTFDTYSYKWYTITADSTRLTVPFASGDSVKTIYLDTLSQDQLGIELIIDSLSQPLDTFHCWVFKNNYNVHIIKAKDDSSVSKIECDNFYVFVTDTNRPDGYIHPVTGRYYPTYPNIWGVEYIWTTDNDSADLSEFKKSAETSTIENVPYKDTYYYLQVVDSTGKEYHDSVFVEAIWPKAEIDTQSIALNDREYYPGHEEWFYSEESRYADDKNSAPMAIRIGHNSKNTDSIQIKIFHNTDDIEGLSDEDSVLQIFDTAIDKNVYLDYEFKLPGTYGIELTAMRYWDKIKDVCYDKTYINSIEIDEGTLISGASEGGGTSGGSSGSLPNVFSIPNGSFQFDDKSITTFEIVIYNRYGKRVHKFEGNIRDWPGWDGRINESNRYVSTGVYFYVIKRLDLLRDFNYYLPDGEYDPTNFEDAFYKILDGTSGADGYTAYKKDKGTIAGMIHVFNAE